MIIDANTNVDWTKVPVTDEIRVYRTFERLKDKLHSFMINIRKALTDDGAVYLYAIKHDEFQSFLGERGTNYQIGFGADQKDRWVQNYTKQGILDLWASYGFKLAGETTDLPEYPSYGLVFKKAYLRVPIEYFSKYLPDDPLLNTVDIGPGNHPWVGAKNYIEHPARLTDPKYNPKNIPKANVLFGDLEVGLKEVQDKQFDFAWASHIFEHLHNPVAGAKELSRIAKRGVVIVPSVYKEAITYFEESDHKWDIMPPRSDGGPMRFVRRNEQWVLPLKDLDMRKIFGALYRDQNYETREERYVKQFFLENEGLYDIVVPWEGEFKVEVM